MRPITPMLANKYTGKLNPREKYDVTLKLDGNRCIAYYDETEEKWRFFSRSGKEKFNYNFDMSNIPHGWMVDGEVLTVEQTKANYDLAKGHDVFVPKEFSKASGLMNRKEMQTGLVYNIFDIDNRATYFDRRLLLDEISNSTSKDVCIVPTIMSVGVNNTSELETLLMDVTSHGAEGLMLNALHGEYQHKRCNDLLKLKLTHTADLHVDKFEYGQNKYDCMVGALFCSGTIGGRDIHCKVGSGLTDEQRMLWAIQPMMILNQIIEVEYFEVTDDGSLRFPRLKGVRTDKTSSDNP